jgi:hypothetical protein
MQWIIMKHLRCPTLERCAPQAAGAIQAYGVHAVVANLLPTRTTRVLLITPLPAAAATQQDTSSGGGGGGNESHDAGDGRGGVSSASASAAGSDQPASLPQPAAGGLPAKDRPVSPWRPRLSTSSLPRVGSAGSLLDLGAGAAAKVRGSSYNPLPLFPSTLPKGGHTVQWTGC